MGTAVVQAEERKSVARLTAADLTGPQKVAVLCMSLGADEAVKLTQSLTPDEAEEISFHIAQMEQVRAGTVEAVLNEWMQMALAVDSIARAASATPARCSR